MLANDPALLLVEPTGKLDPQTANQAIASFEEFNKGRPTIVMVTHNPRAAHRANRPLVELCHGRTVSEGNGQERSLHVA